MTSHFRTTTYGTLEWRGILISVTLEKQSYVDHIQIDTLEPFRAPLPITETGYRSHFIAKDIVELTGGPQTFVSDWLDHAATNAGKVWLELEAAARQYPLF